VQETEKVPAHIASLAKIDCATPTKNPDLNFDPGLKCYPANAVQADHPFPFSNGRMTVAAASDFQLRPVMFSGRPSLLKLVNYRFGNPTGNLEHRRVN